MTTHARAETEDDVEPERHNSAADAARDGTFLPTTLSARVGDSYVSALTLGGYDSAPGEGGRVVGMVEGALFNRVAARVAVDYASLADEPQLAAGLRTGLLRQEQHYLDVGLAAFYKNEGFSESRGEVEMMLTLGRRWGLLGLHADLVYGQGFEERERDGELRLATLFTVHQRVNVGFDARVRFDIGEEHESEAVEDEHRGKPFDVVAGPLATTTLGPVAFVGQLGVHTIVFEGGDGEQADATDTGGIVLVGLGATY